MEPKLSRCGLIVVIALVVLRLTIGWHFYKEGVKKITGKGFSSKYFLQSAKGPFAPRFHALIPDYKGQQRLNRKRILNSWTAHQKNIAKQLGFDDDQNKKANDVFEQYQEYLNLFFAANQEEIDEYFLQWKRLEKVRAEPESQGLAFREQWIDDQQSMLFSRPTGWYTELESISNQFEKDVLKVAGNNHATAAVARLPNPTAGWVDGVVQYLILGIGILIVLGLFTRLACLVGAGFLATVLLSQPFWVHGAKLDYSYYQAVELVACLYLAAVGAGRFAGLDFFLQPLRARCCSPKEPESSTK